VLRSTSPIAARRSGRSSSAAAAGCPSGPSGTSASGFALSSDVDPPGNHHAALQSSRSEEQGNGREPTNRAVDEEIEGEWRHVPAPSPPQPSLCPRRPLCVLIPIAVALVALLGGASWWYVVLGISELFCLFALAYVCEWRWTGFTQTVVKKADDEDVQRSKKLWDWLQLLGIPLGLVTLAFLLNNSQSDRARATAQDAARQQTLNTYVTQMSGLILDHKLVQSKASDDVRSIAHALTETAVPSFDPDRKGEVVRFLYEAGLLTTTFNNNGVSLVAATASSQERGLLRGGPFRTPT